MRSTMCAVVAVLLLAGADARAQMAPSSEELHRLIDEGQYPQALQKISAGLALKGPAAKLVNRHELYMLKGICHLSTRTTGLAAEAFNNAVKEAADDRERDLAAAHVALLKQSKGPAYVPKGRDASGKPKSPIDITKEEGRRAAFAALFADEMDANRAKLEGAKGATTLGPVMDALKPLSTLEGLESAATGGKPEKTREAMAGVAEQAKKVTATAVRDLGKRVTEIDKQANTFQEIIRVTEDPNAPTARPMKEKVYKRVGLTEAQLRELRELGATADKLPDAIEAIVKGLRADAKEFAPLNDEAGRVRKDVDRLLDTDFERIYRELPGRKK
jgi:hypothetical protein